MLVLDEARHDEEEQERDPRDEQPQVPGAVAAQPDAAHTSSAAAIDFRRPVLGAAAGSGLRPHEREVADR